MRKMTSLYVGRRDGILEFVGTTVQAPKDCFRRKRCKGMDLDYSVIFSTRDWLKAWNMSHEIQKLIGQKYDL